MATLTTQLPALGDDTTPNFQAISASDKFSAPSGRYVLYYKSGASGSISSIWALNTVASPTGTVPAANSGGATNWADGRLSQGIPASTDGVAYIADASVYADATGFVNLKHNGTVTTVTVAIFGPF
jgi:hypothetical protein